MKRRLLCVLLALATFSFVSAEESNKESYWFGGVQGGLQFVSTDYNIPDLTMPEFGVQVGRYFVPELGARLSVQGFQTKGGFNSVKETYSFKHITSDLDMLFNLTNIFSKQKYHTLNLVFVAGLGLTNAWDNTEINSWKYREKNVLVWKDNLLTSNFRLGALLDWNITERWAANLELDANFHGDKFNSKRNNSFDFQPTAMLGVNFKFGHKKCGSAADTDDEVVAQPAPKKEEAAPAPKKEVTVPAAEKVVPVEVPTAPIEEPTPAPATPAPAAPEPVAAEKIEAAPLSNLETQGTRPVNIKPFVVRTAEDLLVDIFFEKGSAKIDEEAQSKLYGIADWAKNRKVVVYIKGYADKGSGTPELNKKLSDKRAHDIADEITKFGFRRQDMEVTSYGDTVQPFEENDKNRVVRIEVKELL